VQHIEHGASLLGGQRARRRAADCVGESRSTLGEDRLTEEEKRKKFWDENDAYSRTSGAIMDSYEADFAVKAKMLREEMLRRLPADIATPARGPYNIDPAIMFDAPTNSLGLRMVADELDRLGIALAGGR
jgi:hypothetical protein